LHGWGEIWRGRVDHAKFHPIGAVVRCGTPKLKILHDFGITPDRGTSRV